MLHFRWTDPASGKRKQEATDVPVGDDEAERKRNRRKAERLAADFGNDLLKRAKSDDVATLIERWRVFLQGKGAGAKHIAHVTEQTGRILREAGIATADKITAHAVSKWMANAKVVRYTGYGEPVVTDRPLSAQSKNHYLQSARSFCVWLVREKVLPESPLAYLQGPKVETDRRRIRRPLELAEFARLIAAAANGPVVEGMDGYDRAILYCLASWTGYRRRELASMRKHEFLLDAERPALIIGAVASKRLKDELLPLHSSLVPHLRTWLKTKVGDADRPVLPLKQPGGGLRNTSKMVQADLAAAREAWLKEAVGDPAELDRRVESDFLLYRSRSGEFADFHAQRHGFISMLNTCGASLRDTQHLARHADAKTTDRYTHLADAHLSATIEKLPPIPADRLYKAPVSGDRNGDAPAA
ncbi:MAG TPA: tyrosine-type recombinase/integrase [Pirellulales bacterium]